MTQGQRYNQESYQAYAEAFRGAWMQAHPEVQAAVAKASPEETARLLEEQYW